MLQAPSKLQSVARSACWILIAAGVCIVAGWQFRIPVLKGQALGTFVAPNTALSFICSAGSVLLQLRSRKFIRAIGLFLAVFVTLMAVATGIEYLLSVDLGIDRLFMSHRLSDWDLPMPGRYTMNSVFGFVLAGGSLLTLRRRSGIISELLATLVLLVAYLSIVAYVFGASALYDHVMAIHTAVLFGVLGVALMAGTARHLLLDTLLSPLAGAVASRKMIVSVILLLPLFGGLELWAEQIGLVSMRLGTALSVIATVTVLTFIAFRNAVTLNETDRKRLEGEAALLKSSQLAAAGRMAASIAHEVNNPLEAVTNLIFLLKRDDISSDVRKTYLEVAEKELTRVSAIARRTLGFYRDDAKESLIDVRELVDEVLDIYRNKLQGRIAVARNYCESSWIRARSGEIRQVLTNLVANAIDVLSFPGGTLTIDIRSVNSFVSVSVRDNGPGIPAENLKRIFEPFFTTKQNTGTGLGLWVSRELVLKNKGSILVDSSTDELSHGTRFEITFPAAEGDNQSKSSAAELS